MSSSAPFDDLEPVDVGPGDVDDLFDDGSFGADLRGRDASELEDKQSVEVTLEEVHIIAQALRAEAIYFEINCNHRKGKRLRQLADRLVDDATTSWF